MISSASGLRRTQPVAFSTTISSPPARLRQLRYPALAGRSLIEDITNDTRFKPGLPAPAASKCHHPPPDPASAGRARRGRLRRSSRATALRHGELYRTATAEDDAVTLSFTSIAFTSPDWS